MKLIIQLGIIFLGLPILGFLTSIDFQIEHYILAVLVSVLVDINVNRINDSKKL